MKKIYTLLAILVLAITCFSCSKSSDDSITDTTTTKEKKLILTTTQQNIYVGDEITFMTRIDNDIITDATITINGTEQLIGNKWKAKEKGEFKFMASKKNCGNSEIMVIKVEEVIPPEGSGSFVYKGNTHTLDAAELLFDGYHSIDEDNPLNYSAGWLSRYVNLKEKYTIEVRFYTPTTKDSDGLSKYVLPNSTNISDASIIFAKHDDEGDMIEQAFAFTDVFPKMKIDGVPTKNTLIAEMLVECPKLGNAPFQLNFKGEHNFIGDESSTETSNKLKTPKRY